MAQVELLDAADMIASTYAGTNSAEIKEQIDVAGVQAVYLKNGGLIIPGTNELSDWFDFNLNISSNAGADTMGSKLFPYHSCTDRFSVT